jgi:hypothetical protein
MLHTGDVLGQAAYLPFCVMPANIHIPTDLILTLLWFGTM